MTLDGQVLRRRDRPGARQTIGATREGIVFPGHAELPEVPRGSLDDKWLPVAGTKRLVVITRDKRIRYRPAEKRLWVEHRVRGFVLTGRRSQSTGDSLAILERHWVRIDTLVDREADGPWMQAVTLAGISPIDLG